MPVDGVAVGGLVGVVDGLAPTKGGALVSVTSQPTPTPAPVVLREPDCYLTLDGGLQCFVDATNPFGETLENLTALVSLVDADGKSLAGQVAISPLNILPPGESVGLT